MPSRRTEVWLLRWHGASRAPAELAFCARSRSGTTESCRLTSFRRPPPRRLPRRPEPRESEREFLLESLADGPRARDEILALGRRRHLYERTIERAATDLDVVRAVRRESGRILSSLWSLPAVAPRPSTTAANLEDAGPSADAGPSVARASRERRRRRTARAPEVVPGEGVEAPTPCATRRHEPATPTPWQPTPEPEDPGIERFRRLELE